MALSDGCHGRVGVRPVDGERCCGPRDHVDLHSHCSFGRDRRWTGTAPGCVYQCGWSCVHRHGALASSVHHRGHCLRALAGVQQRALMVAAPAADCSAADTLRAAGHYRTVHRLAMVVGAAQICHRQCSWYHCGCRGLLTVSDEHRHGCTANVDPCEVGRCGVERCPPSAIPHPP